MIFELGMLYDERCILKQLIWLRWGLWKRLLKVQTGVFQTTTFTIFLVSFVVQELDVKQKIIL
jgi:hypothetical protein